jgi:hypothetical protein
MAEDNKRKGERREIMDLLFGERLTWKGVGYVASNEWMMRRREDYADQRGEVERRHTAAGERWKGR